MANTTATFDLPALRRGIEQRDADALLGLYADDAEVVEVSKTTPPSTPAILRGKDAIRAHLADVCGREMTHSLERVVVGERNASFTEACRYPDGTAVLCTAMLDLDAEGRITRQIGVTAWDE
ncbi:MAG: nuclear transport factor 2 family protein [Actinobacteria bacterium]|nr:nuclear transport factor 2 family protein [Actinomycetota bacterium]